jgi:hypothetical protein
MLYLINLDNHYLLDEFCIQGFLSIQLFLEFASSEEIYNEVLLGVEPNDYIKYSVLFWLEGNDPDCVDSILNGTIKFSLKLSIL